MNLMARGGICWNVTDGVIHLGTVLNVEIPNLPDLPALDHPRQSRGIPRLMVLHSLVSRYHFAYDIPYLEFSKSRTSLISPRHAVPSGPYSLDPEGFLIQRP